MRSVRIVLTAVFAMLALTGCEGDMVCIQWTEQEGECPAREDALAYIQPPCDEPIESIDSDGEFDGQSCCYEMTKGEENTCD